MATVAPQHDHLGRDKQSAAMSSKNCYETHNVGGHADVLEDVGGQQETEVVRERVEVGWQLDAHRRVGQRRKGAEVELRFAVGTMIGNKS